MLALPAASSANPYWLTAPVILNQDSVSGQIIPVTDHVGTIHAVLQDGTVPADLLGVDVFFFQIVLDVGSATIDGIGVTVATDLFFANPTGAGIFDDSGTGKILPTAVVADNTVDFAGEFTFGTPLAGGQTSTRMFVVYTPEGDMEIGQPVSLMVSSGANFNVFGTIVPEPGAGLLMWTGLLIVTGASVGRRDRNVVPGANSRQ